jgi:DnaK suppressor protein
MTKAEISHFKRILEARVLELDRSTCRRDAIKIEKIAEVLENNLRASERELAVRTLESEAFKLRESRSALARIEEGTFGICQECEEEISPRRLRALPWAALCIRCQQANDCDCGATSVRPAYALAA